ncbi:Acg family FMN-binding oxidoreductase [Evansella tamaricis]|uniref:Nitroreductase n=1 Tax=Evansella tamaricis TaxID=2069301 RepID=A0ABS6JMU9_9BACI|nr:hypothetical protein [Evansella tamaricis]MBU9714911.1 hypothetical protein [Evansella tamaricis]
MTYEKQHPNQHTNTPMTRRSFIKKSAAAILILSLGGTTWRAIEQGVFSTGQGPAYEPWNIAAQTDLKGPMPLIRDAILASNPHNSQPWLFKITENQIDVFADKARNIGAIDPYHREMYMGLGCAIENIMLSAPAHGYQSQIHYMPNPADPTAIAKITLGKTTSRDSQLYRAIPYRHTHRGEYDTTKEISSTMMKEMETLCSEERKVRLSWFTSLEDKKQVGELIIKATEAIISDKEMSDSSNKWFKEDWKEIQESRDGITLDAQGEPFLIRAAGKMLPPLSNKQNDDFWLEATKTKHIPTATAFGLLAVRDPMDNEQRARAGRVWQRLHLFGASQGLGMHPLNQVNEMTDREKIIGAVPYFGEELQKLTGDNDWEGLFIFRMGYPLNETYPSPRRPIEDVLL